MTFYFESLGCDKTLVDSEHIIGSLVHLGHVLTDDPSKADYVLLNTCCFIHDALQESIDTVLELYQAKKNPEVKLIVFGCMAKRFFNEIKESLPEAEIVIPQTDPEIILSALKEYIPMDFKEGLPLKRQITGPGFYSYLKIADGCNKRCKYCVIPSIRGNYKSIPMEELISEARNLADNGVRELIIVAQETTLYGLDLYGEKRLHILLHEISEIPGIKWIRLMYAYPEEIYDELIYEIRDNKKICHYIDMPLQHCNDNVLKSMGRKTNNANIKTILNKLRSNIPDICIRTTLITGFPGETDSYHQEVLSFIKESKFDRLGAFCYSREENTPAYDLDNQIDEDIKSARYDEIMTMQQQIVFEKGDDLKGSIQRIIVEGYISDEDIWQGRSYMDAPDIDGLVFFKSTMELISGDFVFVKITGASGYDLIGEIYEPTK